MQQQEKALTTDKKKEKNDNKNNNNNNNKKKRTECKAKSKKHQTNQEQTPKKIQLWITNNIAYNNNNTKTANYIHVQTTSMC
jgi:hypothetical protein